jgi:hypothetical protein
VKVINLLQSQTKDAGFPPNVGTSVQKPKNEIHVSIIGVGPDAPTVVNEAGGKQSKLPYRFDLVDSRAMFTLAKVLHEGAEKYGDENWRKIPIRDHLNHLLAHVFAYMAGDESDDHLEHAFCRAMMAVALKLEGKQYGG